MKIPSNTGANGWNGHRIYGAMTYLCNTPFVMYLDDDNWWLPKHIESLVDLQKKINNKDAWTYSLRRVWDSKYEESVLDLGESIGDLFHTMMN